MFRRFLSGLALLLTVLPGLAAESRSAAADKKIEGSGMAPNAAALHAAAGALDSIPAADGRSTRR